MRGRRHGRKSNLLSLDHGSLFGVMATHIDAYIFWQSYLLTRAFSITLFLPRSGSIDAHEMMLALKKMGMEPTEDQVMQDPAQCAHTTILTCP